MKKKLLNLTPQAINAIFAYLSQEQRIVTWISNHNFTRQIYLSDSYNNLFGWPKECMYEDMSLWNRTLIREDKNRAESELVQSYSNNTPFKLMLYRSHNSKGEVLYVEDHHFPIENSEGIIAHGGYVSLLTPDEWHTKKVEQVNINDMVKGLSFYETIMHELEVKCSLNPNHNLTTLEPQYFLVVNNQRIAITPREAETLHYLLIKGLPTKLIACALGISSRTVELHIVHIREKIGVRSRLHLLRLIENIEEISSWKF